MRAKTDATKKVRAHRVRVPLVRDARFERLSLADLRLVRQLLVDEVERAAYWRRVLGVEPGSTHIRRAPLTTVAEMEHALAEAGRSPSRMSVLPGGSVEHVELPDLAELYRRAVSLDDEPPTISLARDLSHADQALADYRCELQERLECVTTQMLVCYREAPSLALIPLPPVKDPTGPRASSSLDMAQTG